MLMNAAAEAAQILEEAVEIEDDDDEAAQNLLGVLEQAGSSGSPGGGSVVLEAGEEDSPNNDAPPANARQQSQPARALEALLRGQGSFHGILDIPPDADDETMVELAIALSLQDQQAGTGQSDGLVLSGLRMPPSAQVCN